MSAQVFDLAVVRGAIGAARPMTAAEVDQLVAEVRGALALSLRGLAELRGADAHLIAGFATWHEACEVWFGDLRALRLSGSAEAVAEREALIWSMREAGSPTRAIRDALGVSADSVSKALAKRDPAPPVLVGADGAARPSRTGRRAPVEAPSGRVWQQAVAWLLRSPEGLTLVELARVAGWTEGKASGALSDVRRRGLAVRVEARRDGQRVHLAVSP